MTSVNTSYTTVSEQPITKTVSSDKKEEMNIFQVKNKLDGIAKLSTNEGSTNTIDTSTEFRALADFINECSSKVSNAVKNLLNAILNKQIDYSTVKSVDKETQQRTEDFINRFQQEFPEPGDIAILEALGYTI